MNYSERFVLPFRWREFGGWFASVGQVPVENDTGNLRICDASFSFGNRRLDGIKVNVEFSVTDPKIEEIFLCTFLADLQSKELFEPFIGNPERFGEEYAAIKCFKPKPGAVEQRELFIPEQGWVLPSIWRFLFQSMWLQRKVEQRLPDIIVFALLPGQPRPLMYATKPFDYFGNTLRATEELLLREFMALLKLPPEASESDVQRAYILSCREYQAEIDGKHSMEEMQHFSAKFSRIKQGYHLWTENIRGRSKATRQTIQRLARDTRMQ